MEGTWKWVGGDAMGIHTVQVIFSWSLQAHVANHVIKFLVIKFLSERGRNCLTRDDKLTLQILCTSIFISAI